MTIWGKILGGTVGFVLGGPLGALVGGLAGHALDRLHGDPGPDDEARQVAFTIAIIALGAKMAKVDGAVSQAETRAFREIFHILPEELENVGHVFDRARRSSIGYELYARQIAELYKDKPGVLEDLLDGLFHIAKADGAIHPSELEFLAEVARIFGFSEADWARIRKGYVGPDQADPYRVLGLARDVLDAELKQNYRKLAKEHHPDLLIGQGLPKEFVEVASDKLAAINAFYERVVRERGLA